jgi:hypothetical protein
LWVQSHEHEDCLRELAQASREHDWKLAVWDVAQGLQIPGSDQSTEAGGNDPLAAIGSINALATPDSSAILVLSNFHRFLQSAEIVQALAHQITLGKQNRTFIVVLSPVVQIPTELEKLFVVLEHDLPSREQLEEIARGIATEDGELPEGDELQTVLDAAAGLTRYEAEGTFSLSLVRHQAIHPESVWELKAGMLKKSGLLSLHRGSESFTNLGGLEALIGICRRRLEEAQWHVDAAGPDTAIPTQRDVFGDLLALDKEFDEVRIDLKRGMLSVVTEEIVLEGIALGRFEIVLDWNLLGGSLAYEVIALDPNPAASSSDTTHPHVQGNQLCEGDGRTPIRRALAEGRLFDFFLLVRQILQSYNPASAYISLEQWHGIECRDCGRLVDEDDRDCCDECGAETCCDCSIRCRSCEQRFCSECIPKCQGCDESFCISCLSPCAGCGVLFCEECLTDARCSSCRKTDEKEKKDVGAQTSDAPSRQTPSAHSPVESVRVGEAAVPA